MSPFSSFYFVFNNKSFFNFNFIFFFKFGDVIAGVMANPFYVKINF